LWRAVQYPGPLRILWLAAGGLRRREVPRRQALPMAAGNSLADRATGP
jgi:hypothetical protein